MTGAVEVATHPPPVADNPERPAATGRVFVTGGFGRTGVDTDELLTLRATLDRAADHLRQARGWAEDARHHVATWGYQAPVEAALAAEAIETLLAGPGGCHPLQLGVETLAEHLLRAYAVYTEAEQQTAAPFRPSLYQHVRLTGGAPPTAWLTAVAPQLAVLQLPLAPRVVAVLSSALGGLLADARAGAPLAVAAQRAVRQAAGRLQHAYPYYARRPVRLRGAYVDPLTLTPVQRVALGALPGLTLLAAGGTRGRSLADGAPAVDVRATTVPTVTAPTAGTRTGGSRPGLGAPSGTTAPGRSALPGTSPQALGTSTPAAGTRGAAPLMPVRRTDPPRTSAQLLRRAEELGEEARARGAGIVEVLRSTDADGRRSWTVIVPGTQQQLPGGANPMDNLTNVQAMAGAVSDMEIVVATALDQAGVQPGESIAMAAHSQGALVAARLLGDPLFATRYRVDTLLTAGGPVGGLQLPRSVSALSLEDVDDPVVALDGLANAPAVNHLTVFTDTRGLTDGASPHSLHSYATAAELLETVDDRAVRAWSEQNRAVMGVDRPGAVTDSLVFEAVRTTGDR